MGKVLEIRKLTKYYGKVKGVEEVSLSLEEGEIFGFIGPNGAGKSTTIRSVMNLIQKTAGTVYLFGKEFTGKEMELKKLVGYLPSEIALYDDLTVKGMLDYHETFYPMDIHDRRVELVERLKLDEKKNIEDLSLGNLKKLGIILALMHEPKLVILDEPTSGLDPIMQNVFYQLLLEEKKKGTTIFYSTHILSEVSKICDRVGIIRSGKLIQVEKVEELSKKNLTYVTVTSDQWEAIAQELGQQVISQKDSTVKFANKLPHNEVIRILAKYPVEKVLIEEPSLEDLFLHYYEEDK
ncbi:MAG: ABC transporter ATP-binding protein [Eubacterium sp.]|nr:ABC transporter ATP-binding protein [Eubacterium sp.]